MLKQFNKIFRIVITIICFHCLPLLASPTLLATPGNEVLLEDKQLDAILYVTNVSVSQNAELKGIELAWIPESVRAQCMGKQGEECRQLWYEKAIQRHNQHIKSQENIPLSDRNLNYSFGTGENYPPEVLTMWIFLGDLDPSNKKAFNQISQLEFIKDLYQNSPKGENKILISENKKFHAKIRYLAFSNGQSFQVIDVINK